MGSVVVSYYGDGRQPRLYRWISLICGRLTRIAIFRCLGKKTPCHKETCDEAADANTDVKEKKGRSPMQKVVNDFIKSMFHVKH